MCNVAVIEFFMDSARRGEFEGRKVLEVGSKYVNGSVRPIIERFCSPAEYIGVDVESGKYVDMVLPAERLVQYFGEESFDIVVSTELLEHVRDWRVVINNMKAALRRSGYMSQRAQKAFVFTPILMIFGDTSWAIWSEYLLISRY